jgi:hypothetical protein
MKSKVVYAIMAAWHHLWYRCQACELVPTSRPSHKFAHKFLRGEAESVEAALVHTIAMLENLDSDCKNFRRKILHGTR